MVYFRLGNNLAISLVSMMNFRLDPKRRKLGIIRL